MSEDSQKQRAACSAYRAACLQSCAISVAYVILIGFAVVLWAKAEELPWWQSTTVAIAMVSTLWVLTRKLDPAVRRKLRVSGLNGSESQDEEEEEP